MDRDYNYIALIFAFLEINLMSHWRNAMIYYKFIMILSNAVVC